MIPDLTVFMITTNCYCYDYYFFVISVDIITTNIIAITIKIILIA